MPCYYPVGTYRVDGTPTYRPCGNCIGCRLEYSRQWAVRCVHEASLYEENSFLTLTYNDENLPEDRSVKKSEMQNFMKRLRKKIEPRKIRFFGCGEYGERLGRPHYHLCLFNYDFPDKILIRANQYRLKGNGIKKGNVNSLYSSKMLEKIWKKGFVTVGDLTFESAGYVARYVTKKITGPPADGWYKKKDPEFSLMSRRPGIGTEWLKKYFSDVYPKDFHTLNGHKMRPTLFYDSICKRENPELFKKLKENRQKSAKNGEDVKKGLRGYHLERHRKQVTKTLERGMENEP